LPRSVNTVLGIGGKGVTGPVCVGSVISRWDMPGDYREAISRWEYQVELGDFGRYL
jgi:hypothetical protein